MWITNSGGGGDCKVKQNKIQTFTTIFYVLFIQVLMMVVPLIFIVIMPKLINTQDPEIQKVSSHEIFKFTMVHGESCKKIILALICAQLTLAQCL